MVPVKFMTGRPPQIDSSVGDPLSPINCSGQPDPKLGGVWKKFPRENPKRSSETTAGETIQVAPAAIACERQSAEPKVSLRDPSAKPGRGAGVNRFVSEKEYRPNKLIVEVA